MIRIISDFLTLSVFRLYRRSRRKSATRQVPCHCAKMALCEFPPHVGARQPVPEKIALMCGRVVVGFSSVILLIQSWWSSQVGTCGRLQRQTAVTPWHLCISPSVVSFKRNFLLFEIQTWWSWERDVLPKTLVDMSKSLAAGSRSLRMLLQRTFAGPCGGDPPPV